MAAHTFCAAIKYLDMKTRKHLIVFCSVLFLSITISAQNQIYIGANINAEFLEGNPIRLGGGLTFEKKLKEHHGIESGLFYRNRVSNFLSTFTDPSGQSVAEYNVYRSYLSIPIHYKYYSNKINFSIGLLFDSYLGWTATSSNKNAKLTDFFPGQSLFWGFSGKIGKCIFVSEKFILEPEIRCSILANVEPHVFSGGIGLIGKFDLSKVISGNSKLD